MIVYFYNMWLNPFSNTQTIRQHEVDITRTVQWKQFDNKFLTSNQMITYGFTNMVVEDLFGNGYKGTRNFLLMSVSPEKHALLITDIEVL